MAAVIFSEFDSSMATVVADIKAAVLTSADWSNPSGDLLKSTSTSGVDLVVNLTKAAVDIRGLTVSFWRAHDGSVGTDESPARIVKARSAASITSLQITDPVHVVVSASKDHLLVTLEGTRPGETAFAETVNVRDYFLLSDVVRYDENDLPVVWATAREGLITNAAAMYRFGMLSRNKAGTLAWQPSVVGTISQPGSTTTPNQMVHRQSDGDYTFFPFVVFGAEGIRGRLRNVLFGGSSLPTVTTELAGVVPGQRFTYAGCTWMAVAAVKTPGGSSIVMGSPLWAHGGNSTASTYEGPLLIVPVSGTPAT